MPNRRAWKAPRRTRSSASGQRARPRPFAVDLPSGLDADTGQPLGACVGADRTVTIGLPKLGLALEPGRSLAGRIAVARIGIADAAPGLVLGAELWTRAAAARRLPPRPRDGHKGRFGHVLVVAGSEGKSGAAALAALGALRTGAGLVTVACPGSLRREVSLAHREVMTAPVSEGARGCFGPASEKEVLARRDPRRRGFAPAGRQGPGVSVREVATAKRY